MARKALRTNIENNILTVWYDDGTQEFWKRIEQPEPKSAWDNVAVDDEDPRADVRVGLLDAPKREVVQHEPRNGQSRRVLDFIMAFKRTVAGVIGAGTLAIPASVHLPISTISPTITIIVLGLIPLRVFYVEAQGFYFDGPRDRLTYPAWLIRRSIRISDIRDADGETMTRYHASETTFDLSETKPFYSTTYSLSLSGAFGGRTLYFSTNGRRSQFVSTLMEFAEG